MGSLKKKTINYEPYDEYLYSGLQGFVMRQNHRLLSKGVSPKYNFKILEIGGGAKMHCSLVNLVGVNEYWVSDLEDVFDKKPIINGENEKFIIKKHVFDKDQAYTEFLENGHRFSRIIVSHVWEHVDDPEDSLLKWFELLDEGGQLDIAIPCDPGLLWRIGQLLSRRKAIKLYGMTPRELDLDMARQHINPCHNLIRIMRYYAEPEIKYFPSIIPIIGLNLFVFFRVKT